MGRFTDKVVLISGGARGMGAACARRCVADGASVLVGDVLADEAAEAAAALGARCAAVHLDVTEPASWEAAVADAEARFGRLDGLVNNAGVLRRTPIAGGDLDVFRTVIAVNQTGVYLGMRAAVPAMVRAGRGAIVNVSSIDGMLAMRRMSAYVASKWAVRGLTKSAAQDLGPLGIRVNSVHPGGIATPMVGGGDPRSGWIKKLPLARWGQPDDVANVVTFLASDEAAYVTGAEWSVDGGATSGDRGIFD